MSIRIVDGVLLVCGGIEGGRPIDSSRPFEAAVEWVLGEAVLASNETAIALWSALANTRWRHANGETVLYSYRAAGDLVAALRDEGDYLDWYCCGVAGNVRTEIAAALAAEGWTSEAVH